MAYLVYKATNTVNGKVYVGVTRQPLATRMIQHKSTAGRRAHPFAAAIAKYGFDAFIWEVVTECADAVELAETEQEVIHRFDCMVPHKGYNRTAGGGGMVAAVHTDEGKRRISDGLKRFYQSAAGAKFSEKIRQSLIGQSGRCRKLPVGSERDIAARVLAGESRRALAAEFGVVTATITAAIRRVRT